MTQTEPIERGGPGSGYFAPYHRGRPNEVGGSLPAEGGAGVSEEPRATARPRRAPPALAEGERMVARWTSRGGIPTTYGIYHARLHIPRSGRMPFIDMNAPTTERVGTVQREHEEYTTDYSALEDRYEEMELPHASDEYPALRWHPRAARPD